MRVILRTLLLLGLILLGVHSVQSQVLDDSTKQVYGPTTTQYFYLQQLKYNQFKLSSLDTSVHNFHRYTNVQQFDNLVQDLGNLGSASRPLYYAVPEVIGVSSGYHVYDSYFKKPSQIRFYDSKSPFTEVMGVVGGVGRSVTSAKYARNISPRWNFGFDYLKVSADKQLGPASRGDRNVESNTYDVHTNFRTKNDKYWLLADFSRIYHYVFESGGIKPLEGDLIPADLFEYRDETINLSQAQSRQLKQNYHLYHQYELNKVLQVYHEIERTNEVNYFYDFPHSTTSTTTTAASDLDFLGTPLISSDSTLDKNKFRFLQNELGIKGDLGPIFYSGYVKRRNAIYDRRYLESSDRRSESYFGFNLRADIGDNNWIGGGAEIQDNGNHLFRAEMNNKLIKASYKRARYSPAFMHLNYLGNHDEWYNTFELIASDQISGEVNVNLKFLKFRPFLSLTNVNRQIYFDTNGQPQQASGSAQLLSPGLELNLIFWNRLHIDNTWIYTAVTGDASDVFRIPELVGNLNVYFSGPLFHDKMYLQVGVEGHHRSEYFAMGYDPVVQQFHLQNTFQVPDLFWADAYANFRIGRVIVFAKVVHLNMGREGEGYFTTPWYTGQRRTFDVGMKWLFFD